MAELANFPMISQRDGDPNQNFDCVPASIAACMTWLTGQRFSAREIKDAVYGVNYIGGTAGTAYIDYCKSHGVILAPVNGNGNELVATLHTAIEHQIPCLITEPSSATGWTHVCAAFRTDSGSITVMDPWLVSPVQKTDAEWAAQLEFNQIWTLEKAMLDISSVSNYFEDLGNDVWKCTKYGTFLGHGMLDFFRSVPNPLALIGLPRTNEIAVPGHPGVVIVVCERMVLCYDPGHVIDAPPGAGAVYAMHIDDAKSLGVVQLLQILNIQTTQPTPPAVVNPDIAVQLQVASTAIQKALTELK